MTYYVTWEDELQKLEDRGWIQPQEVATIKEILEERSSSWGRRFQEADEYLYRIAPDTVKRHPNFASLISLLAFGRLLDEFNYKKESQEIGAKIQDELLWISNSYTDEENPFPFQAVGEAQTEHKIIEENIKILDRFLKSIE